MVTPMLLNAGRSAYFLQLRSKTSTTDLYARRSTSGSTPAGRLSFQKPGCILFLSSYLRVLAACQCTGACRTLAANVWKANRPGSVIIIVNLVSDRTVICHRLYTHIKAPTRGFS